MTNLELLEALSRVVTGLHNAMDEINDIPENEIIKKNAMQYMIHTEMEVNHIIDEFEASAITEGTRSGAV